MPMIGFGLLVVCLLMPYWIYEQVKANHKLMIKGFAEPMNALDPLEVRWARMERAAAFPPLDDAALVW